MKKLFSILMTVILSLSFTYSAVYADNRTKDPASSEPKVEEKAETKETEKASVEKESEETKETVVPESEETKETAVPEMNESKDEVETKETKPNDNPDTADTSNITLVCFALFASGILMLLCFGRYWLRDHR